MVVIGFVLPGCVSTGGKQPPPEQPPVAAVHQVQSLWQGRIVTTADVVHQGAQLPGLAGRVYLLGPDLANGVKGKGKLAVDLYETDRTGPDGQPRLAEHYEFPDDVLNRLLRKDTMIGWGYTVFLPWPEYRAEIKHVRLKISFTPENGSPLFAQPTQLSLRNDEGPILVERTVPASSLDVNQTGATIPMRVPVVTNPEKH
jgi:hypothetical protein